MLNQEDASYSSSDEERSFRSGEIHLVSPKISVRRRLVNIWRYRELLSSLVRKEITVKYKNSVLGFAWSMLNPAMYILIYYVVFQKILKNGVPLYAIYIGVGLLVWNFFQTAVQGATGTIVDNAGLVKKVAFPREILSLASVGAALVFFFFQAIVLIVFLLIFQVVPAFSYLWILPFMLLGLILVASALAVLLSAANVYFRDVRHLVELLMLAWFWATPVVYTFQTLSSALQRHGLLPFYFLNPVTSVVLLFQRALYAKVSPVGTTGHVVHVLATMRPEWYMVSAAVEILVGALLFLGALAVFSRVEGNFAEEL
ncbi:MAG: ABC transporter permease [Acidimicrobiales bacterium]